ncbi:hypothetical protein [Nocardioides humi]|uniref:GNAT family N-acetyltransferase n=1 Tax=Nocardioides humi TaxID=449461 RepID=A0ABN1ZSU3_9ACTN|nr:hypothetical protein [Nocardioides humi]
MGRRTKAAATCGRFVSVGPARDRDVAVAFYRRQGFEPDGAVRVEPEGRELRMVRPRPATA